MSVIIDLATALAGAIDDLQLFDTKAVVAMIAQYDTTSETGTKVIVTPYSSDYERKGRLDFEHDLYLDVVVYKFVGDTEVDSVDSYIEALEKLALAASNANIDVDGTTYTVTDCTINALYDSQQLEQNFVYSGAIRITFARVGQLSNG